MIGDKLLVIYNDEYKFSLWPFMKFYNYKTNISTNYIINSSRPQYPEILKAFNEATQ